MSAPINSLPYCNSLTRYSRLRTREVKVGDLGIGGNNPIRLQSMTTTDTMDTLATVDQSIRMIEAGCEIVRITAPSIHEARNLGLIKNELRRRGFTAPLCADIHFTPNAAETAARIVEKVRVNPGNYADKKKFEHIEYTDSSYEEELERIRERFTPLVKICKEHGTVLRIGTNHGSLSDRILSRYGDTPLGMVESAVEFLQICEDNHFYNIVLSMKASNPQVMVQAYRLLVSRMLERNAAKKSSFSEGVYPLHLGVTEAGEGEDGRIKSAVGIGALLEDGLGDTIRVSLTEDPEFEIPVAKVIADRYTNRPSLQKPIPEINHELPYSPFEYERRKTREVLNFGGHQVPRVVADFSQKEKITPASLFPVGYQYSVALDKWNLTDQACDFIYTGDQVLDFEIPGTLGVILDSKAWDHAGRKERYYPLFTLEEFLSPAPKSNQLNFITINVESMENGYRFIADAHPVVFVIETRNPHGMAEQRRIFAALEQQKIECPVLIKRNYAKGNEETLLHASTDIGALFIDGFGDGIWISQENGSGKQNLKLLNSLSFGMLQATRTRISKTEYISCPSCGRTLFDLQETTARIRSRTDHLKGIKIGIMGCIVNGPGEMADADYGYVGTGPGKITLYKGKEVVKRNVPSEQAVDELVSLIRENGDWIDVKEVALSND